MNKRMGVMAAGMVLLSVGAAARADRRAFVWTYEYMTMPQGTAELEYYVTSKVPDTGSFDDNNSWEHQLELEYGLTDHWDIAVYQQWMDTHTDTDDNFEYKGTKFRSRYRLAERGVYPVDILGYLEYKRPDGSDSADALEAKLILAKDIGKFNIAYNQIVERALRHPEKPEHGYACGISYELDPRLKVGLESKGNLSSFKYYLGPTISWASKKFWLAVGVTGGLNNRSDDLQARLIAGIPFH